MITGKTNCVGILGYPVGHSLSPVMHNAAFKKNQMDYVYIPLPTAPSDLGVAVSALKAWNFCGANVTIPHKVAVMEHLDEIAEDAQIQTELVLSHHFVKQAHPLKAEERFYSVPAERQELSSGDFLKTASRILRFLYAM